MDYDYATDTLVTTDELGYATAEIPGWAGEAGTTIWTGDNTAFGIATADAGLELRKASYTGKDYDSEAGLYYFNARWYDAELGRFTTEDPARDDVNWYVYCANRPMTSTDPDGLKDIYGVNNSDISVPSVHYAWPMQSGSISSAYGPRDDAEPNPHPGIDIANTQGTPIQSVERGTVTRVGTSTGGSSEIFITHTDGTISVYKHMGTISVQENQEVVKGQVIATVGDVGSDGAFHLHFEIRPEGATVQADAIDPIPLLPSRPAEITLQAGVTEQDGTLVNN